jgi:hypothetical protein
MSLVKVGGAEYVAVPKDTSTADGQIFYLWPVGNKIKCFWPSYVMKRLGDNYRFKSESDSLFLVSEE